MLLEQTADQSDLIEGVTVDTEKRVPHPALGFLSFRWMLRALLQLRSETVDILIDPLTAAIFDLELSYGLQRDTTQTDQNVWPAEHLAYLKSKSSAEDRKMALVSHRDILDAPRIEIELATLKLRNAFEYEAGSGISGYAMSKYWGLREVADWTVGEVRDVRDGDAFHESVRTRWLATRLPKRQLDAILDEASARSHAHGKVGQSPHTLTARAKQEWAEVAEEHTIAEPYVPMASPHGSHAEAKRTKFWTDRFAKLENENLWVR